MTDALDEPDADLGGIIAVLVDDVRGAVRSFLGLAIHPALEGISFLLTAIGGQHIDAATTRESRALPRVVLPESGSAEPLLIMPSSPRTRAANTPPRNPTG